MDPRETQERVIDEFCNAGEAFEQYDLLLRYAAELDELDESRKTTESLVKGCQSQVWLHMKWNGNIAGEGFILEADSDTLMVRGVLAILARMFNGQNARDIEQCDVSFVDRTDLVWVFDAKRQAGVESIVAQIKDFCRDSQ